MAEWLRGLTRKPKVRTAVGSNPALDSLVAVRNSSPGQPVPCEGNLVAAAGSCGGLMVKHPWPLLEVSLSDFHRLATLNIPTYLPTCAKRELTLMVSGNFCGRVCFDLLVERIPLSAVANRIEMRCQLKQMLLLNHNICPCYK